MLFFCILLLIITANININAADRKPFTSQLQDNPANKQTFYKQQYPDNNSGRHTEQAGYTVDIGNNVQKSPLSSQHVDIGDGEEVIKAYREYDSEEQRIAAQNQIDSPEEQSSPSSHLQEKHQFTVETSPLDEKYLVLSDKWEPISQHTEIATEEEEDDIPIVPERLHSDKR